MFNIKIIENYETFAHLYQNCVYILKNNSKDFYASKIFSLRNKIKYSTLCTYSEIR